MGCSCDGVVLWGCSVAVVVVVVAWHWYIRRQFWVSQVSLTGVVLMLLVVVVMCGGVVVGVVSAAVVLGFGLLCLCGVPRIILSICRCVRCNLFSSSCVIVHEGHPYSAVGVTVPWNSLSLSRTGYVL